MTSNEVDCALQVGAKGTIPEASPQEASALKNGNLPTSGWSTMPKTLYDGKMTYGKSSEYGYSNGKLLPPFEYTSYITREDWKGTILAEKFEVNTVSKIQKNGQDCVELAHKSTTGTKTWILYIFNTGEVIAWSYSWNSNYQSSAQIKVTFLSDWLYTISDTSITANSDILMELTDDGGVKAYSMEAGKATVIRDTVPTQPIPYTYKVKQTNASGQFTLVNHFVPTKTSDLQNDSGFVKTSEANTFTAEQTFSNTNGIKANKVNNLNGNAWYDFDGTNDKFGNTTTPTIIRTSEARPKAEVPSGSGTATKEIALLEDTEIKGEWSEYTSPNVTLTESGLYQIWAPSSSTASEHWEAFVYWDGTSLTKKQMFVNYYQSNDSEQTDVQRIYLNVANIRITNAGVLSIEEFNTKYSLEGALISSSSSNAGFKYRKIN